MINQITSIKYSIINRSISIFEIPAEAKRTRFLTLIYLYIESPFSNHTTVTTFSFLVKI